MNKPPREFNKESARLILAALKFSAFREQSIEMENKLLDDRDVNAIIYYIEKRHVELEAYDQLKKENEELIYKNWALKNAYDNVDDKNTKLKSMCERWEKLAQKILDNGLCSDDSDCEHCDFQTELDELRMKKGDEG